MKIIFIASNLKNIGGIQNYNKNLLKVMRNFGQEVKIIELKSSGFFSKIIFVAEFFIKIMIFKPNFIFCSHINFSPICYWVKMIFNIDYSITIYGIEVVKIKKSFIKPLKKSKFIVKLFDNTVNNLIKQLPELKEKLTAIPNSINEEEFFIKKKSDSIIRKYNLEDKKTILTISRLSISDSNGKGYKRVIRAMPQVLKAIPEAVYILVGGGDDVPTVEKLILELGLENKIILTGSVKNEELIDYYNTADIFVLPSKNEGFPAIVVMEALACGKVVVVGRQSGTEAAFGGGKLGIIIDPDNIEEIAKAIIAALKRNLPDYLLSPATIRENALNIYGKKKYEDYVRSFLSIINS